MTPDELDDDFEQPFYLPKRMPEQQCPRCGNNFPGGLKRCTACGLDITKVSNRPEAVQPWPGYDQNVIICKYCGFASSDDTARRHKIQKCDQCNKVIYIPSGLYSHHNPGASAPPRKAPRHKKPSKNIFVKLILFVLDRIHAILHALHKSKMRWPIILFLVVASVGLLLGLRAIKSSGPKIEVPDSPAKVYYQSVLKMRTELAQGLQNFVLETGYKPDLKDFAQLRTPANQTRFVTACDRVLKNVEDEITVMSVKSDAPPEAINHRDKFIIYLTNLQRYYARLKDGIKNNDEKIWQSAFELKGEIRDSYMYETAAFDTLRPIALDPANEKK